MTLSKLLKENESAIREWIVLTDKLWESLLNRVTKCESSKSQECHDEQLWTFMLAGAYAYEGASGVTSLCQLLVGNPSLSVPQGYKIWIEALPLPPRHREGNTNLDLAIGNIETRPTSSLDTSGSQQGMAIRYGGGEGFVCFCEMKWYSDIDTKVTHDLHRNQLARVIENVLAFSGRDGQLVPEFYVSLVTPSSFRDVHSRSRLYWYKYHDYRTDRALLATDLSSSSLELRNMELSNLISRTERLGLAWLTYEELVGSLPANDLGTVVSELFNRKGLNSSR